MGLFTCVTGVSGSGKSTLVREVLLDGLLRALAGEPPDAARADAVVGAEEIRAALEVDQAPIGRTPRSVPASYVGILDDLRRLYARIPEARARGYTASRFSFNVRGGRCETCQGQGEVRLEMSFLPEARIPCEDCEGRRFNPETLEVNFKGASMAQVLAMTVDEALPFTAAHPRVARGLQVMQDLGLGYLPLGQPSPTLSGGEAQRVKLAAELVRSRTDDGPPPVPRPGALYVLDEPTTGLSGPDAERLGAVLRGMVTRGETVVVIEHNLDFLRFADHVVDLGPVGGEGGGRVQYQGTPAGLAARADLATGRCLARLE
ncbi:MAG: hypothetical protein HY722_05990 [Planctomycetes bacterium]|nr:hypothetical protein [Planctomycetota bacterium]